MDLLPRERGILFGWRNKALWLRIALLFSLLDGLLLIGISNAPDGSIIKTGLTFVSLLFNCLFLSVVTMAVVDRFAQQNSSLLTLFSRSIERLPQVIISVFSVYFVVWIGGHLIGLPGPSFSVPLLILGGLMGWAPVFVILDSFARVECPRTTKDEDDDYGLGFLEDEEEERNSRFFNRHTFFDLGIGRSLNFSLGQISFTFSAMWMVGLGIALPFALDYSLFRGDKTIISETVFLFVSEIMQSIFLASAIVGFILSLPEIAKLELGLKTDQTTGVSQRLMSSLPITGFQRFYINFLLVILSVFAVWGSSWYVFTQKVIPDTTVVVVEGVSQVKDELIVKLFVSDSLRSFAWLDPRALVILGPDASVEVDGQVERGKIVSFNKALRPTAVVASNEYGESIRADQLSRQSGLLKIELHYQLTTNNGFNNWYLLYRLGDKAGIWITSLPKWSSDEIAEKKT